MFTRRLTELKARELELRLRSMEVRDELHAYRTSWAQPMRWARVASVAGGGLGLAGVLLRLRHDSRSRRLLGWLTLGLQALRVWRQFSEENRAKASSGPASEPPLSEQASPNP